MTITESIHIPEHWFKGRKIATRLVITGDLTLTSPAHLGNGDRGAHVDLPLLRDATEGRPLLQGSSLAGALRNYMRAYEQGFAQPEPRRNREKQPRTLTELLFGGVKGDDEGEQSPLIINDALAAPILAEIRDGVRIDGKSRTAQAHFKYDLEILPPGTVFPLRFELLLPEDAAKAERLQRTLALALTGLADGAISLGARKSRGYGRCTVITWHSTTYALRESPADLLAWLAADHPTWGFAPTNAVATQLAPPAEIQDRRKSFQIVAQFALASPLLIRSEEPLGTGEHQPDVIQLRDGEGYPVISGTSLAGVLRSRAGRILRLVQPNQHQKHLNGLFGRDMDSRSGDEQPTASRLIVHEARISGGHTLVQNRVSIDRFTGGAFDTALFSEAPHVGGTVELTLTINEPTPAEKGLLLLLLKDLWTGDVPIGGTASIGRGRLRGQAATLNDEGTTWTMSEEAGRLHIPDAARPILEGYVSALHDAKETHRGA